MKILMLLENEFPPDVRVENEMLALISAGHHINLACSTKKGRPRKDTWNGAIVHRKPMSSFIHKSSVGSLRFQFYFNFWRKFIKEILNEQQFDVIHIHDLPLSIIGAEIKEKYGIRLVIDLHENWPALLKNARHTNTLSGKILSPNKQWVKYEKLMLRSADLIITIIEEARDRVVSLGIDPSRVVIVSNTINISSFPTGAPIRSGEEELIIFYAGGITRPRGLQTVIEAIKKSGMKNIKFWIVGDGSYRPVLERKVEQDKLSGQVKFFGFKPFTEMMGLLSKADTAVIPHLRNENNDASSPNKLYQYMFLGKPVISSNCLSLERMILETDSGYIYKHDDSSDLASILNKIYSDRKSLEEKGKNGRKAVLEKYNWEKDGARLVNAYSSLESNMIPRNEGIPE